VMRYLLVNEENQSYGKILNTIFCMDKKIVAWQTISYLRHIRFREGHRTHQKGIVMFNQRVN